MSFIETIANLNKVLINQAHLYIGTKPGQAQACHLLSDSFWLLGASLWPQLVFGFPRTPNKWLLWGFPGMRLALLVGILGALHSHISTCLQAGLCGCRGCWAAPAG